LAKPEFFSKNGLLSKDFESPLIILNHYLFLAINVSKKSYFGYKL